ncbi:MAG: MBL fold metallo-hydrolase [Bacteroidetes bacterium GWF2_33_16]|nr:MAG: MBL fold metallo-hydrolase [Bacteroidetes bacterium GWE2_32_14]OFY07074.1 MAG: MBL fold metallo-hydrolase [Bacteroidetes bacterium GWF2_33_16]
MIIKFLGAAQEVTGSKHLIKTDQGKKILLDCGMFQGKGLETDAANRKLGFIPEEIDHIILTHAHIDHSGLIPYVYKLGFRGSVICTNATRDLCSIMFTDSAHIQEHDTYIFNKRRIKKGLTPVEPLYDKADAFGAMELFIGVAYNRKFRIDENTTLKFTNTGHMLGSGVANLEIIKDGKKTTIAYTGDIGRPENRILKAPAEFPQADILITEATYGDRLHTTTKDAEETLLKIMTDTCVHKKGKLIIPSFSVGRTQEIVYSLNNLYNEGRLPRIDIYVDSPLSVNATNVFRMHPECFNSDVMEVLETDPDPFGFNSLFFISSAEDSKKLNTIDKPCVIISASGMMEAGRVKHHLANSISNPNNTVLAVGYCSPSTLGARILRGEKTVSIHGNIYDVKAEIHKIDSFSGHGDYKEMGDFISCQDKDKLGQVFLVHGDIEAQKNYKSHLESLGFKNISIPAPGEEFEI